MPYIFVTTQYPSHKAQEVGEAYLEGLKKYPPDRSLSNEVVPAAVKTTLQGIKVMAIIEPKAGKFEETLARVNMLMAMYMPIEGLECAIETYGTVSEAMTSIGMSLPE
jgi:hypothetical protein